MQEHVDRIEKIRAIEAKRDLNVDGRFDRLYFSTMMIIPTTLGEVI